LLLALWSKTRGVTTWQRKCPEATPVDAARNHLICDMERRCTDALRAESDEPADGLSKLGGADPAADRPIVCERKQAQTRSVQQVFAPQRKPRGLRRLQCVTHLRPNAWGA